MTYWDAPVKPKSKILLVAIREIINFIGGQNPHQKV